MNHKIWNKEDEALKEASKKTVSVVKVWNSKPPNSKEHSGRTKRLMPGQGGPIGAGLWIIQEKTLCLHILGALHYEHNPQNSNANMATESWVRNLIYKRR